MLCRIIPLLLLLLIPLEVSATDTEEVTMPPSYTVIPDSLPPELESLLPEGLLSENAEEALSATADAGTIDAAYRFLNRPSIDGDVSS